MHVSIRLGVVVFSVLVACTPTPREDAPTLVMPNTCASCPTGLECQFGACAAPDTGPLSLTLEIIPPSRVETLRPQRIAGLAAEAGQQLPDLHLSRAVRLTGTVTFGPDDNALGRSAAAVLAFASPLESAAGPRTFYARARDDGQIVPEGTGPLDDADPFYLPPGTYDVTITPLETDVPPQTFTGRRISDETAADDFELVLPDTARARVDGRVLVVGDAGVEGLANVRVTALDPASGAVSTTSTTDGEGSFFVVLPGEADAWVFEVEPGPGAGSQAYLRFTPFDVRTAPDDLELLAGAIAAPIDVFVALMNRDGAPIEQALISASTALAPTEPSVLGPGLATGRVVVTTRLGADPDDLDTFEAVPGDVTVTVGALDGEHGTTSAGPRTVDSANNEFSSITIPERTAVSLTLFDPTGAPVPGALVVATPERISTSLDARFPVSLFGASAATDANGEVALQLQPGRFQIELSGGDAAVATAAAQLALTVQAGFDPNVNYVLPFAGVSAGRVLDERGQPLRGATVRAWSDDVPSDTPLASSVTDANGRYRLALPFPSVDGS